MNSPTNADFRNALFISFKLLLLTIGIIHLFVALVIWRQGDNMYNQVQTETGNLLRFVNLLNLIVVATILLVTAFVVFA